MNDFKKITRRQTMLLLTALPLAACQSAPAPPAPAPPAATVAAPAAAPAAASAAATAAPKAVPKVDAPILSSLQGAERDRVADLIQAARKERELNWLDNVVAPESAIKLGDAFKQRYAISDLTIHHEKTTQVAAKVQEEVRADRLTTDLFAVASPRFFYAMKEAGALAQYDSPEYKNYENVKKAGLTFEPGYWMSQNAYSHVPMTNSRLYPKPINSWYDILDPELKGKLGWVNSGASEASLYHYVGLRQVLPKSYFEQLATLDPEISAGSSVERTQQLASGDRWLVVTSAGRLIQTTKQTGQPLKAFYPKEGVPLYGQPYGIPTKAPHPSVARLFVDFLYSEEGQNMYVALEAFISTRDGIKIPEELKIVAPPLAEVKSIPMDWKGLDDKKLNAAREEFQQIFKR